MTRVPPHVPAPSAGYHVLPVRTIALIGLKPVRRHNLRLRCRRWVIFDRVQRGLSIPLRPKSGHFRAPAFMSTRPSTTLADFIHAVAFRRFVFCSTGIAVVVVERLVRRWRGVRLAGSAGAVDH